MSFLSDIVDAVGNFLQDAWNAIEDLFSSDAATNPVQTCPAGSQTPAQAQAWIDHFRNDRKDIPFDYPVDCCYTRAREMAREMKAAGVSVQKVWNYASGYPDATLHVETPNVPSGSVDWRYHVAPVVPVCDEHGTVTQMVIDPSMSDKPLTVDEWVAMQNDAHSTVAMSSDAPYFRTPNGSEYADPGDEEVQQTLAGHRASRSNLRSRR